MTKARDDAPVEVVRAALEYNASSGLFVWRRRPDLGPRWNGRYAGTSAGCVRRTGYVGIYINDRCYLAHRLAWVISHGEWPRGEVDHIDGNPSNNRLSNLRLANRIENSWNVANSGRNKSGYKGVSYDRGMKSWVARIKAGHRYLVLGYRPTPEAAAELYESAATRIHGDFLNLNSGAA